MQSTDATADVDSPVPYLLETNDAPSFDESLKIQEFVDQKISQLEPLQSEWIELHERIRKVLSTYRSIQNTVYRHRPLLSPLRRLPPELISEIFVHCLPPFLHLSPKSEVFRAPLILAGVCQSWRRIALSTPALWTNFSFTARWRGGDLAPETQLEELLSDENLLAFSTLCLSRSKAMPLRFSFCISSHRRELAEIIAHRVLHMMVLQKAIAESSRWHSVCFRWDIPGMTRDQSVVSHAPLLENLEIFGDWSEKDLEWGASIIQAAPRLRSLTWSGPANYLLALQNLTLTSLTLKTHVVPLLPFLQLLQILPSLVACDAELSGATSTIPPGFPVITNSSIRTFIIETEGNLREVLDHLNLPALTELSICFWDILGWPGDALDSMMSRSACRLTSLELIDVPFEEVEDMVISHLDHESIRDTLIKLSLHSTDPSRGYSPEYVISYHLLDLLTCDEYETLCLPQLKSLQFSLILAESSGKCKDMVLSRKPDVERGIAGFEFLYILMFPVRASSDLYQILGDVELTAPSDLEKALKELRGSPHVSSVSWEVLSRSDYIF